MICDFGVVGYLEVVGGGGGAVEGFRDLGREVGEGVERRSR